LAFERIERGREKGGRERGREGEREGGREGRNTFGFGEDEHGPVREPLDDEVDEGVGEKECGYFWAQDAFDHWRGQAERGGGKGGGKRTSHDEGDVAKKRTRREAKEEGKEGEKPVTKRVWEPRKQK
jgi:hypothetical protein